MIFYRKIIKINLFVCILGVSFFSTANTGDSTITECARTNTEYCVSYIGTTCIKKGVVYNCTQKTELEPSNLDVVCTEGTSFECTEEQKILYPDACSAVNENEYDFGDMGDTLTKLAVLQELADKFDTDNMTFFNAQVKKCGKDLVSFNNCCADDGWGQSIGLASCSSDEEALAVAKAKELTIEVGTYCSEKSAFGICLKKKTSYCVYDSKMSRTIMAGANSQLNRSLGSPSDPDCSGLDTTEMGLVSWSDIDFTNVIGEITAEMDIPTTDELENDISTNINDGVTNKAETETSNH